MFDEAVQEGIVDFTNESYLEHASKVERANRALPPDQRRNASKMAIILENAVMALCQGRDRQWSTRVLM